MRLQAESRLCASLEDGPGCDFGGAGPLDGLEIGGMMIGV